MARVNKYAVIRRKASQRAEEKAREILRLIKVYAPRDANRRPDRAGGRRLANSYYLDFDVNGDPLIRSRVRYWQFVEYGTAEHGDAQPHVRPAIDEVDRRYG